MYIPGHSMMKKKACHAQFVWNTKRTMHLPRERITFDRLRLSDTWLSMIMLTPWEPMQGEFQHAVIRKHEMKKVFAIFWHFWFRISLSFFKITIQYDYLTVNCNKQIKTVIVWMMSVFSKFQYHSLTQTIFEMTQIKMSCGTNDPWLIWLFIGFFIHLAATASLMSKTHEATSCMNSLSLVNWLVAWAVHTSSFNLIQFEFLQSAPQPKFLPKLIVDKKVTGRPACRPKGPVPALRLKKLSYKVFLEVICL